MKEATGDMTMTIVVIVGIVAVLTLGTTVVWPAIRDKITDETDAIEEREIESAEDAYLEHEYNGYTFNI